MKPVLSSAEMSAWLGFVTAQGKVFRRVEDGLKLRSGLSHPEYEVLVRLADTPDRRARIQELAAASLLSRSGTSRAVDRLVKAGHLTREGAEEDGRGAYAVLTDSGLAHLLSAREGHLALVREVFSNRFSAAELSQLAEFLRRLRG